jgi:hypothetical protein
VRNRPAHAGLLACTCRYSGHAGVDQRVIDATVVEDEEHVDQSLESATPAAGSGSPTVHVTLNTVYGVIGNAGDCTLSHELVEAITDLTPQTMAE